MDNAKTYLLPALWLSLIVSITLTACGGSSDDTDEEPNENPRLGMIIPAYEWPDKTDPSNMWPKMASAAKKLGKKLIIAANANNGPGETISATYADAIRTTTLEGAVIIGYVATCYGNQSNPDPGRSLCPKTEGKIQVDVDRWYAFYPEVQGIFYDQTSNKQEHVEYYRNLYSHAQGKNASEQIVVNNTGLIPHKDYADIGSILVMTEDEHDEFVVEWKEPGVPPDWARGLNSSVMLFETPTTPTDAWRKAADDAVADGACWLFITHDGADHNPWDSLPPWFDDMVNYVADKDAPHCAAKKQG